MRGGSRVILRSPAKSSCDRRGRVTTLTPGISCSISGRIVPAPISMVSARPRRLSSRSVKTWPRSRSAASWISSIATKSTARSRGIASTVQTQKRGRGGLIFSSPVTSATRVDADLARRRARRPRAPAAAAAGRSCRSDGRPCARSARWVLPVLVGPSTAVTPLARAERRQGARRNQGAADRESRTAAGRMLARPSGRNAQGPERVPNEAGPNR